jgi:hypothetical protein
MDCGLLKKMFIFVSKVCDLSRREFAKFEAERQRIKMPSHSNPIFRQATTTVQNPTFNSPNYY